MPLVASKTEPALPSRNLACSRPAVARTGGIADVWRPLPPSCDKSLRHINSWSLDSQSVGGSGRWSPGPSPKLTDLREVAGATSPSGPAKKAAAQQTQIVLIPPPDGRASRMTDSFRMCRRDRGIPGQRANTAATSVAKLSEAAVLAASSSAPQLPRARTAEATGVSNALGETSPDEADGVNCEAPGMAWEPLGEGALHGEADALAKHTRGASSTSKAGKKSSAANAKSIASGAQPAIQRPTLSKRFSISTSTSTWLHDRRRSETSEEGLDGIEPGMTLKEWFDAAEHGQESSTISPTGNSWASPSRSNDQTTPSSHWFDDYEDENTSVVNRAEQQREAIRKEMIRSAGGAQEAFRIIDLSGNKCTSPTEFSEGMKQLGIKWQEITGLTRLNDLFKLFDTDKNGSVNIDDIFPEEQYSGTENQRVSTPEFWNHWCRRTQDSDRARSPKWQPAGDEELQVMCEQAEKRQEIDDQRKRMGAMIRRLKRQGKSDARCRECVALHLPRGTGPKDRDAVQAFTDAEVRACKRAYNDPILSHVRNIQKVVYQDMREQRRDLQTAKSKLWKVTMEPIMLKRAEEDQKKMLEGLHLFGPSQPSPDPDLQSSMAGFKQSFSKSRKSIQG